MKRLDEMSRDECNKFMSRLLKAVHDACGGEFEGLGAVLIVTQNYPEDKTHATRMVSSITYTPSVAFVLQEAIGVVSSSPPEATNVNGDRVPPPDQTGVRHE